MTGCQYIGPEQDPHKAPLVYCGCQTLQGKSYCGDHYWRVYQRGTAIAGRRNEKAIDHEIAALKKQQEIDEAMSYE